MGEGPDRYRYRGHSLNVYYSLLRNHHAEFFREWHDTVNCLNLLRNESQ